MKDWVHTAVVLVVLAVVARCAATGDLIVAALRDREHDHDAVVVLVEGRTGRKAEHPTLQPAGRLWWQGSVHPALGSPTRSLS